ncbi:MAG: hypothetical protein AAFQ98_14355 [Bacteroidota bacterium]
MHRFLLFLIVLGTFACGGTFKQNNAESTDTIPETSYPEATAEVAVAPPDTASPTDLPDKTTEVMPAEEYLAEAYYSEEYGEDDWDASGVYHTSSDSVFVFPVTGGGLGVRIPLDLRPGLDTAEVINALKRSVYLDDELRSGPLDPAVARSLVRSIPPRMLKLYTREAGVLQDSADIFQYIAQASNTEFQIGMSYSVYNRYDLPSDLLAVSDPEEALQWEAMYLYGDDGVTQEIKALFPVPDSAQTQYQWGFGQVLWPRDSTIRIAWGGRSRKGYPDQTLSFVALQKEGGPWEVAYQQYTHRIIWGLTLLPVRWHGGYVFYADLVSPEMDSEIYDHKELVIYFNGDRYVASPDGWLYPAE